MVSDQRTLPNNVSGGEETLLSGANENVYEDQRVGAELSRKDINRVAWRSMRLQGRETRYEPTRSRSGSAG